MLKSVILLHFVIPRIRIFRLDFQIFFNLEIFYRLGLRSRASTELSTSCNFYFTRNTGAFKSNRTAVFCRISPKFSPKVSPPHSGRSARRVPFFLSCTLPFSLSQFILFRSSTESAKLLLYIQSNIVCHFVFFFFLKFARSCCIHTCEKLVLGIATRPFIFSLPFSKFD